jgi:hypothetical protein
MHAGVSRTAEPVGVGGRLSVAAYCDLQPIGPLRAGENRRDLTIGLTFPVHGSFPQHANDLDATAVYCAIEKFSFIAGCYSRYNRWLEQLGHLAGIPCIDLFWRSPRPAPFAELLDFADCDGTIGTAVCQKLAGDFAAWAGQAAQHPERYFRERFVFWRHAFEVASQKGCVVFRESNSDDAQACDRSYQCI